MPTPERLTHIDLAAMPITRTISTADLKRRLDDPRLVIVDTRSIAAYNGWRLHGEARGGHIRGAVTFPLTWLTQLEPEALAPLLVSKGLTPNRTIVVYGDTIVAGTALAAMLIRVGYTDVLAYEDGLADWADDPRLPMERLAHYEKLVYPEWVHRLITGKQPETYPGRGLAVFHVTFGAPQEYADGHIPGAFHLDTQALESPATGNRRSPAELKAALLGLGITRDKTIVLYGRDTVGQAEEKWPGRPAGHIAAARAAAILMYAGVEDVRLLDGGYDVWVAANLPLEKGERRPERAAAFGSRIPRRPDYFVDLDEANAGVAHPAVVRVSGRVRAEPVGDFSGDSDLGPRGRIAGAVWGNHGSDADHRQHYRNADNTMRDYHEIEANWKTAGITPDKRVAFYCGTDWRAAEAFFCAYLLGWEQIAIYDGGWLERSRDPANPVEAGPPEAGGQSTADPSVSARSARPVIGPSAVRSR